MTTTVIASGSTGAPERAYVNSSAPHAAPASSATSTTARLANSLRVAERRASPPISPVSVPVTYVVVTPETRSRATAPPCSPMAIAENPTSTALNSSSGCPEATSQPATTPACAIAPQTSAIVRPADKSEDFGGSRTRRDAAKIPSAYTTSDTADRISSGSAELPTAILSKTMLPLIIAVNTLPRPRKLIASTAPDPNV